MMITLKGVFGGQTTTKAGVVKLRFEFGEDQFLDALNLNNFLGKLATVKFENKGGVDEIVGSFLLAQKTENKDFVTKIVLETTVDQVQLTSLHEHADFLMNITLEV